MTDLTMTNQTAIDRKNSEFWNELCGSQLARQLGVTDNSPASLKKFDDWYFDFYPYLYSHIPFAKMRSKQVLEIGLGYGTVSQKIAEAGALYHGLDIAAGPVAMVAERCRTVGANTAVVKQGSILEAPFETGTFDWVVAIGCLHHTGKGCPGGLQSFETRWPSLNHCLQRIVLPAVLHNALADFQEASRGWPVPGANSSRVGTWRV